MKSLEVLKIIKACKEAGILELKCDDLELRFQTGDAVKSGFGPDKIKPPTDDELNEVSTLALKLEREDDIEDELASLQIDDPSRFEDLLVERELEFSGSAEIEEAFNDRST